jgi:pyruvate,orthophosphate dikinase
MPGILDTFLNVGLTVDLAQALAARPERAWATWDAYRRFLQFWGMSQGIERDRFDGLLREAKRRDGVQKKSQLSPERVAEVALAYRALLLDHRIPVPDDPFEQLEACVRLVLRSWHTEKARLYRSRMQISEEWGTGVLVQRMVYGNLHERSGTGVVLTCDPRRSTEDVRLFGDFVVQGQGDDVVSGLVETFPISESDRPAGSQGTLPSLERDFPRLYESLARIARFLIADQGMFHQEIEFTFEGDAPEDLYLLQSRDVVLHNEGEISVFVAGESLESARIAAGIGAAGGAISGRAAHTSEDVAELRRRVPGDPILLLRPDTVPDDIPLILQADGILAALGGATSHAAIAAQRLGRTCVVGCRSLQVDERARLSLLAGREIATGDFLSINGVDGSIYLGRHPTTVVPQRRGFA